MKREDFDWSILTGSIVTLAVSLVISGALVSVTYYFQKQMALEYNRNNAQFQAISQRYLAVDEEEKLIKRFLPEFVALHKGGVIGEEQRLNWIEVLREAGDEIGLPSLTYEIRSRSQFLPEFTINLGRFQLYSSEMTLNLQMLHEGDMFRLFEYLDAHALGSYSPFECKFSRVGATVDTESTRGNLVLRCDLNWFTINLADGTAIKV